jgi:putative ubiquitin-RnfH superfamily antitoxin RatB of RatAB toxin-antitoxin module
MAENFRQGDRVEWHNSPQITPDPQDLRRARVEHGPVGERGASDDGGEGSPPTDQR